jgi:hypothetical protein
LLAVSLAIKPHDGGAIWLYFLLSTTCDRTRALKALLIAAALSLASIGLVTTAAPHWLPELRSNLGLMTMPGWLNDPRPASISSRSPTPIIDLQTVAAEFDSSPGVYNPLSYGVCGALFLVWIQINRRSEAKPQRIWFALAALVPIELLISYHRPYDAKLLLLSVPACATLCSRGGPAGAFAFLFNAFAVVCTSDFPLTFLLILTRGMQFDLSTLSGKVQAVLVTNPAPLALLTLGIFNLWAYRRFAAGKYDLVDSGETQESLTPSAL